MAPDPQIVAIEQRAAAAGLKMAHLLREAEIAPSTWTRWRSKGVRPLLATVRRLEAVLNRRLSDPKGKAA